MQLKRLEIKGFKSFCESEDIDFNDGITMIVGPNGCGKSNIIDAFRWVMGEKSAKALRGENMENVIFNGTESKKPVGRAEVTITMNNDGKCTLPPQYARFTEIQVTRRLFRDGASEYLINKVPCRMKDIVDIFLAGGIGMKTYSIIEQGRVQEIVQSRPEQRRLLIEDAAGITKYKKQKQVAERKLENVENTILRLNDVLSELEKRLRSLKRQSNDARRYKTLSEKIRQLDLYFHYDRYSKFKKDHDLTNFNYLLEHEQEVGIAARINVLEEQVMSINLHRLNAERKLGTLRDQKVFAKDELSSFENGINTKEGDIGRIGEARERYRREIAEADEKLSLVHSEEERLADELRSLGDEKGMMEGRLVDQEKRLTELSTRRDELVRMVDEARSEAVECSREITSFSGKIDYCDEKKQSLTLRQEKIGSEQQELREGVEKSNARKAENQERLTLNADRAETLNDNKLDAEQNRDRLKGAIAERRGKIEDLKTVCGQRESRLHALENLDKAYEGLGEGVKAIMNRFRADNENDVVGLLAEAVRTESQYEAALEAALGEKLKSIVVRQPETGVRAIEFLAEQKAGRGYFVPADLENTTDEPESYPESDRIIGRLIDLVEVEPSHKPLFDYLLRRIVVVDDLDRAMLLFRSAKYNVAIVTLDGQLIDRAGVIAGGTPAPREASIIGRKREMRELKVEIEKIEQELAAENSEKSRLEGELEYTDQSIAEIETGLQNLKYERIEISKTIEAIVGDIKELERRLKNLTYQEEDLMREDWELGEQRKLAENGLKKANVKKEEFENAHESHQRELGSVNSEQQKLSEMLTDQKVAAATIKEKFDNLQREVSRHADDRSSLQKVLENRHSQLHSDSGRREELEEQIVGMRSKVADLIVTVEETEKAIRGTQALYDNLSDETRVLDERTKISRARHSRITEKANKLLVKLSELRPKMENVVEKMQEQYIVDITEFVPGEEDKPDIALEDIEEEISALKRRRENIGPVNLGAIEEFEEVTLRHDRLDEQKNDLEESIKRLRTVISRINKTIRERFLTTFEAINEKFGEIFPILFEGGKGALKLVGSEDLLECGVDIMTQPPGKLLPSVSLMSGGEKALTAVALIFAILLFRPSPFFLLDEVDAPFDDANIDRFHRLLKRMSQISQIIMITHNKRTMEIANNLFGVTMEEKGISKVITVRVN
jgi:chromosome segregation protein